MKVGVLMNEQQHFWNKPLRQNTPFQKVNLWLIYITALLELLSVLSWLTDDITLWQTVYQVVLSQAKLKWGWRKP